MLKSKQKRTNKKEQSNIHIAIRMFQSRNLKEKMYNKEEKLEVLNIDHEDEGQRKNFDLRIWFIATQIPQFLKLCLKNI